MRLCVGAAVIAHCSGMHGIHGSVLHASSSVIRASCLLYAAELATLLVLLHMVLLCGKLQFSMTSLQQLDAIHTSSDSSVAMHVPTGAC